MRCQWVCSHLWQWSPLQANQPALTSPEQIKKLLIVKPQIRNIAKDTYQKTHAKQNVILPPQFPCLPFLTWLFNNCTIKNGVCVKRKSSSSEERSAEKPLSNNEKFFPNSISYKRCSNRTKIRFNDTSDIPTSIAPLFSFPEAVLIFVILMCSW